MRRVTLVTFLAATIISGVAVCAWYGRDELTAQASTFTKSDAELPQSDAAWRSTLTPEQYRVCRGKGTEWPFRNAYWNNHRAGVYHCVACGEALFESTTKYDSGTGWPSFWAPIGPGAVAENDDRSLPEYPRVEITCRKCGSHLGHLFPDGPTERTGMRYCVNSTALDFREPREPVLRD